MIHRFIFPCFFVLSISHFGNINFFVDGFATVTVCLGGLGGLACEDGCGNLAIVHN